MTKRMMLAMLATGLVGIVLVATVVAWMRPSRVNPEAFGQIDVGMTRAEVAQLLGPQYRPRGNVLGVARRSANVGFLQPDDTWCNGDYYIEVVFRDDRVLDKSEGGLVYLNESVLAKLRRWCGL